MFIFGGVALVGGIAAAVAVPLINSKNQPTNSSTDATATATSSN